MPADGSDDARATAKLSQSSARRLPKSMDGRSSGQASLAALVLEPMREAYRGETPPVPRCQKCKMLSRRCVECCPQIGMRRNRERRASLALADVD